ncbi:bifunctional 2-polyprenyl-6-hydroxyphenol methylase/3-demethylubiquinol 3-O-methyltransferase UbiG [Lysinibacillus sp. ZYM-1]|uniref:class I SAM-dependent methyltransferase n=1 Tax=Lysinibacillus sp. ZYM-1 TaxID=1681184 RepID=UPI0006CE9DC2|nr:class I SAM-dependent methyltransferase [Lysinibacillus sp. ZYM-1]KPN96510.1 methyltransferase [Lysinibacillus sp. ZYM-1]
MKQNIYDNPEFFHQYKALRQKTSNYNRLLEQPTMKSLLPPLLNLQILDIGCGMGEFAKYCIDHHAKHVTALDVSSNMLTIAQLENAHPQIDYQLQAIEDYEVAAHRFDCITSSLSLHYVKDFEAVIGQIARMLSPDGVFIFSVEHPIATSRKTMEDNWIYDTQGYRLHYAMDHYQEEGLRQQTWLVDGVVKYHRTIATMINTLIDHGLSIDKIVEPIPSKEAIQQLPSIEKELRRPSFLFIKAKK